MPLTDLQKKTAQAIVNILETSRVRGDYGAVTVIAGDPGHLTYGRSQVTLSSGGLHDLLAEYCASAGAQMAMQFQPLLPRFRAKDLTLDTDRSVHRLLREAGKDHAMHKVQDAFFDKRYWVPSCKAAAKCGGFGVIYAIKTLDQVKAQAIAAKDSLDLSRDTAQRQLRAYVRVYAANIEFRVPDRPVIEVHFKNCGATPAYRVRTWIGLGLGEWPLNKALPAPPEGFQGSRSVLAPGGQEIMPAVWKQPIPAPLLPFLGTRQATVYVFGRTEYIDTFKNAWYTEFRLLHGGPEPVKLDANKDGILVGKLKPDQEGNEAT